MAQNEEEEERKGEAEEGNGEEDDWAEEDNCRDSSSLYPMYFGISSSFLALHLLSAATDQDMERNQRRRLAEMLLHGSASLLGLLFWRAQMAAEEMADALRRAESQVAHLKSLRAEDAKANEKVMGIVADRKQRWIADKRKLKLQIQALMNQFRVLEVQKQEAMAACSRKIAEKETAMAKMQEEKMKKLAEMEEEKKKMEEKEAAMAEMQEEKRKNTAEMEEKNKKMAEMEEEKRKMVAAMEEEKRQMTAEMEEKLRAAEKKGQESAVTKETELAEAHCRIYAAESAAERLAAEMAEIKREVEQKERLLSAVLRKSKADAAEKARLKMKRRVSASNRTLFLDYQRAETKRESDDEEHDARYHRRRRRGEVEALADQLRQKDEKLEAYKWRLIKKEVELKSLKSHAERLDAGFSHFREESANLEAQLLRRERELKALKNQLSSIRPDHQNSFFSSKKPTQIIRDRDLGEMNGRSMGVDFKIKRLKQQLLIMEQHHSSSGFLPALTLLMKQVKRYQTLQEKADELCSRIGNGDLQGEREGFLEEAFLLQRSVVAAGQKMGEIQSWVSISLAAGERRSAATEFNLARFAAVVRILFREVQAGMEGRIARIIGNLEETLACHAILQP